MVLKIFPKAVGYAASLMLFLLMLLKQFKSSLNLTFLSHAIPDTPKTTRNLIKSPRLLTERETNYISHKHAQLNRD